MDVTCFSCKQKGHYSRECPQRRPAYGRRDNRDGQRRDMDRDRGDRERTYPRGQREVQNFGQQKPEVRDTLRPTALRRKAGLCDGIYIRGIIQGTPVVLTADTGASETVLSARFFNRLDEENRPEFEVSNLLKGAGGAPLNELGKGTFSLQMGPLIMQQEMVVADIEDDCLLGIDVQQNENNGPADMMLSRGVIKLQGHEIPCTQIGMSSRVRKVTATDTQDIPGYSETLIEVTIERNDTDDLIEDCHFLIEPTDHFISNYPLRMAATLVDINKGATNMIRLLNPYPTRVTVRQDVVLGCAERIGEVKVLATHESNNEDGNNFSVRRIQIPKQKQEVKVPGVGVGLSQDKVPEHLQNLYESACKGLLETERAKIAELLVRHQDVFSRNEWGIGLTNITEHSIDTGDAPPIKQRPRKVPLAFASEEKDAIEDLKAKGVIRESTSPWASPLALVRKKNGSVRPCVDYMKLNELVKPDGFPMPHVKDCLVAVAGSTLFSTFDLTSGYFQIPLKEADISKVPLSANTVNLK
ncbi:uncharacterized protein LOC128555819 [Mercenaria mercenaria]|uniref:uncharacterized protein LOC128555819 n=1 Tax=Mercenaria mercenaria TaxID=6596 RepID=UPI00234EA691|nr:uncharacterized protein LOC128555819 [Mercenaria mercenaria]